MAKAQFHRHQRVWVECVGAWAVIEKVVPVWAKGFGEPVRVTYDVGMGREFLASELKADQPSTDAAADDGSHWRVLRARNKWQEPEDCLHHPYPGTYPVVVTDMQDWGGWRTPGAEYDRDPHKVETQARIIASGPKLLRLAADLQQLVAEMAEEAPLELQQLARRGADVLRYVSDTPPPPAAEPQKPAAAASAFAFEPDAAAAVPATHSRDLDLLEVPEDVSEPG